MTLRPDDLVLTASWESSIRVTYSPGNSALVISFTPTEAALVRLAAARMGWAIVDWILEEAVKEGGNEVGTQGWALRRRSWLLSGALSAARLPRPESRP